MEQKEFIEKAQELKELLTQFSESLFKDHTRCIFLLKAQELFLIEFIKDYSKETAKIIKLVAFSCEPLMHLMQDHKDVIKEELYNAIRDHFNILIPILEEQQEKLITKQIENETRI